VAIAEGGGQPSSLLRLRCGGKEGGRREGGGATGEGWGGGGGVRR